MLTRNMASMIKEERQNIDEDHEARTQDILNELGDLKAQQTVLTSQITQVERESKLLPAQLKFEIPQIVQQHMPKLGSPSKVPPTMPTEASPSPMNEESTHLIEKVRKENEDIQLSLEV